jgi:hypothetical protein
LRDSARSSEAGEAAAGSEGFRAGGVRGWPEVWGRCWRSLGGARLAGNSRLLPSRSNALLEFGQAAQLAQLLVSTNAGSVCHPDEVWRSRDEWLHAASTPA